MATVAGSLESGKNRNVLRRLTDVVVASTPIAVLILSTLLLKADSTIKVSADMVANGPQGLSIQADAATIKAIQATETPVPPITVRPIKVPSPSEAINP